MEKVKQKLIKLIIYLSLSLFIITILLLFVFKPIDNISDINTNPEIIILNDENEEIIHYINNHPITSINLDNINPKYIDYLLYIEDKSFYKHSGFNLQRIFKTIITNIKKKEAHGASTITQQYIKNIYLNNSKSTSRKIKEL